MPGLSVTFQTVTLDETQDPWLACAAGALRLAHATPTQRDRARDMMRADWHPTVRHLEDVPIPVQKPTGGDWQWLRRHPSTLGMDAIPWQDAGECARQQVANDQPIGLAGARALAVAMGAHVARNHPAEWAMALTALMPGRARGLADLLPLDPRLGWEGRLAMPDMLYPGSTGVDACKVMACEDAQEWGARTAANDTGTMPVDARTWPALERLGLRDWWTGEPDF